MTFRRFIAAALMPAILLCCSGCLPHTELNKQAIVEAIGVDYSDEGYEVSVQYFNMEESGGSTLVDSSKANVVVVKGRGTDIQTAIESASVKCGQPFMFGITAAIVFGEEAAKRDLVKSLSFAETYYQSNPKTLIAVAKGKASDIMDVKFKDGVVSVEHLRQLMVHAEQLGLGETKPLYKVMNELRQPTGCTILPLLATAMTESGITDDGRIIELSGGVLLSERVLTDTISLSDLSGLQFLRDKIINTSFSAVADGQNITVSLYNVKTKVEPKYGDKKLTFKVKINALGKYIESQLQDEGIPYSDIVEEQCESWVKRRIEGAVSAAVNKYGTDPVGLCHRIMSDDLSEWLTVKENFSELLKTAEFSVECNVKIDRFGITH